MVAIVLETIGAIPAFSPFAVLAGGAAGAFFAYMFIVAAVDLFVPRIRLVITAEFNGILGGGDFNLWGIVQSLTVPDKNGKLADVALGFDNLDSYLKESPYFGAVIGRYGNRIGKGQFTLDGKQYQIPTNNGPQCAARRDEGFR